MTFSLNEVAAMARKAARGAGYPWGLAEEAAMAVRWLSARGLDGCGALSEVLARLEGGAWEVSRLQPVGDRWRGTGAVLCPLVTGAALADRATVLPAGGLTLEGVVAPLVLLPFAAGVARMRVQTVRVSWAGSEFATDGTQKSASGGMEAAADVRVRFESRHANWLPITSRASPDPRDWETLEVFAARTYAPATEASRQSGAGAGETDND